MMRTWMVFIKGSSSVPRWNMNNHCEWWCIVYTWDAQMAGLQKDRSCQQDISDNGRLNVKSASGLHLGNGMNDAVCYRANAVCNVLVSLCLSLPLSSIYPIRLLLSSIWLFAGMRRRHTRNLHIHTAYTSHNYSSPYHVHSHLSATHDLERDYINIRSVIQIFIMNLVITGITYSYMNINIWWFWRLDNNKIWVI